VKTVWCRVEPPYPVLVGPMASDAASAALRGIARDGGWDGSVLVVSDRNVAPHHAAAMESLLASAGLRAGVFLIEPGEGSKSIASYGELCAALLRGGLSRRSAVAALGGGVVGDLAGFAAATYARGIPWISVPTTLLAQVDSGIGGKVAVNLPEAKNMIGAFHQPALVVADPASLRTLPERDFRAGLAEVIKAALIGDAALLALLESSAEKVLERPVDLLTEVIERAVAVKCSVVAEDERDEGRRRILNLGHTFGHALETATGYRRFSHGEAVAAGLVASLWMSSELGYLEAGAVARIEAVLREWSLPVRAAGVDGAAVLSAMGYDKKFTGGERVYVLLKGWGEPWIESNPPEDLVRRAVDRMTGDGGRIP